MTPTKAAATIQRIADSGLDLDTNDYRALVEIAQWLMTIPAPQQDSKLFICTNKQVGAQFPREETAQ